MIEFIVFNHYFYITLLLFSISGLLLADFRYKIALFANSASAIKTIGIAMGLLLLFDVLGIINHIFYTNSTYVTGIYIINRNMPIEELFFLFLLCYFSLFIYIIIKNKLRVDGNQANE